VKRLGAVVLALSLAACGGGGDTSSNAGGNSTLGAGATQGGSEPAPTSTGDSAPSGNSGSSSDSASSSLDGTYRGQFTATLSGEGVLPVSDSSDLVIEISGSDVTATAEGRSYKGELDGNEFSVEIPIDEESRGITCQGKPVLKGKVEGGKASGSVSGTGQCYSDTAVVPVLVTGDFSTRK
jgi:hypothetical protein